MIQKKSMEILMNKIENEISKNNRNKKYHAYYSLFIRYSGCNYWLDWTNIYFVIMNIK